MSSQRVALLLLAVVLALGVMLTPATLLAQETTYSASLSGSDHTPPITTDATGTFAATVDLATGAISYTLTVPSITAATAAHIHLGAAGESGPVVVPLFAAADGSVDSIDVSSTAGAADLVGPFAGDPLGFVTALLAGNLYVNVHTMANPPGEIRGQIQPGAAAPAPAAPPTGNAGIAAASQHGAAPWTAALLLAAVVGLAAGARALTAERRRIDC
jgi:hypothetical protein